LSPEQEAAWKKFKQAGKDLSDFVHKVAKEYPSRGVGGPSPCTAEQALDLLRPNEAAVSFVLGKRESFAVVLRRGSAVPPAVLNDPVTVTPLNPLPSAAVPVT
jgi:hypothetical protein